MSFSEGEDRPAPVAPLCPQGHPVGEHDLFCPACLEVVPRSPGTYWTVNDGRDLHPSSGDPDSLDKEPAVRQPGRYCHRKRH